MAYFYCNSKMQTDLPFDAQPLTTGQVALTLQCPPWPVADDWQALVEGFWLSQAGQQLHSFLLQRQKDGATIYPPQPLRALQLTPLASVKVVILGQDPYHGPGQGQGLAFSVAQGVKIPPSLRNIFKERQRDLGLPAPAHGSLQHWAEQGVLLLNTTLTVEDAQPASHAKKGWEVLTDRLIQTCARQVSPIVFMLWGGHAQAKQALIAAHNQDQRHLVLSANHPSPLSALRPPAPFMGCAHFSTARTWVARHDALAAATLFAPLSKACATN
jgi:uracil-DNA glycosylase